MYSCTVFTSLEQPWLPSHFMLYSEEDSTPRIIRPLGRPSLHWLPLNLPRLTGTQRRRLHRDGNQKRNISNSEYAEIFSSLSCWGCNTLKPLQSTFWRHYLVGKGRHFPARLLFKTPDESTVNQDTWYHLELVLVQVREKSFGEK